MMMRPLPSIHSIGSILVDTAGETKEYTPLPVCDGTVIPLPILCFPCEHFHSIIKHKHVVEQESLRYATMNQRGRDGSTEETDK